MKNFEYKGRKSPVADLQLGGLYRTNSGATYYKKYPSVSKFNAPQFSGNTLRVPSTANRSQRRFLGAGSQLLNPRTPRLLSGARNINTITQSPVNLSSAQIRRRKARRTGVKTLNFGVNRNL